MKNIVIFGSGPHSKVVIDIVEKEKKYNILGLIDSYKPIGTKVLGYEVIGDDNYLLEIQNDLAGGIVAVADNWIRKSIVDKINSLYPDFPFIKAIHPSAQIGKDVNIGQGTVVMPNAVINSDTTIGEHCIINTKASVDHDGLLGDYVTVAPGATLAGTVSIGDYSVISMGANVIHNRTIGEHTVIGVSSTVLKDVESNVVAYGTPAKRIRSRKAGEKYL